MHDDIKLPIERAEQFLREMEAEYKKCFAIKSVTPLAQQLTHDVCEKIKSSLDRIAYHYFTQWIKPSLAADDVAKARIYFPIADDHHSFESTLGNWRWKAVRGQHLNFYDRVRKLQPYEDNSYKWLSIVSKLANHGKHVGLTPQTKLEETITTVTRVGGGGVSWGSNVIFGEGVSIMGAPVDPRTQRIRTTPGVTERQEIWVSFLIDGYDVNALEFCKDAVFKTKIILVNLAKEFGL
ncbi:hypothetical protein [Asaia spathodeae]|uniref:Uncharacterized protein n=1 Tax=Asaia spathodeae TaxID=657016 RepID=A0ABX2P7H8_9PROT|nr:hypothetical protein [Asaia spathodeae]GBR17552.1 hypothetical protein AA105894_1848 [Asaia spathodeae NBRC 105894]